MSASAGWQNWSRGCSPGGAVTFAWGTGGGLPSSVSGIAANLAGAPTVWAGPTGVPSAGVAPAWAGPAGVPTVWAGPTGEHPLLQFCHPALALIGFGFWLAFVFVHYRPLAWVSFGVLVVTVAAGLSWLTRNTLAARRHQSAAPAFPPRQVVLHGLAAAATLALTVLTALTAGHG